MALLGVIAVEAVALVCALLVSWDRL